jgi:hypothetical protein
MKPTRRIILISLLATIVAGLAVYLRRPKEPSYQGKTVREWMAEFPQGDDAGARQAFRVFGTNAIPMVVQELCASDSKLTPAPRRLLAKQSVIKIPSTSADSRQAMARMSIDFLSAEHAAQPALALLVQHLRTETDSSVRWNLFYALARIGLEAPEAVPFALAGLKDPNSYVRAGAFQFLARTHSQHAEFASILLATLRDQDDEVRSCAVEAIVHMKKPPPEAVPALRFTATNDSNPEVRKLAVDALAKLEGTTSDKAGKK